MQRPIEQYVHLAAQELSCIATAQPQALAPCAALLRFCDDLGQLMVFGPEYSPVGFVAWYRYDPEHLELVKACDFATIATLPRFELTHGRNLYIAETWTKVPKLAAIAARELAQLPGVERISAHTRLALDPTQRRWRERPVRKRGLH